MARVYLKPGDRVQALCEVTYAGTGQWKEPEMVEGTTLRLFRESPGHEDGGEWFQVRYDFDGRQVTNEHWGELYFDDEQPGY